jgi:hypothetical protein
LRGRASLEFGDSGLECVIEIPLPASRSGLAK